MRQRKAILIGAGFNPVIDEANVEFTLTVGMSGVELARRVLELTKHQVEFPKPRRNT